MINVVIILNILGGLVLGLVLGRLVEYYRDKDTTTRQESALREITNHKWDTGEHNDAVVITRIAIRGLEGE